MLLVYVSRYSYRTDRCLFYQCSPDNAPSDNGDNINMTMPQGLPLIEDDSTELETGEILHTTRDFVFEKGLLQC